MKKLVVLALLVFFGSKIFVCADDLIPAIRLPSVENSDLEGDRSYKWNEELKKLKKELSDLYHKAPSLYADKAEDTKFLQLLQSVRQIKREIGDLQEEWRQTSVDKARHTEEGYGIWDLGETTLSNLVMEYGSNDFIYIIPQNLSSIKIHLYSALPVPKESWAEMVDLILSQNGIGVKLINPFVKQLYMMKQNAGLIEGIAHTVTDLELLPNHARIAYVFSPKPEELKPIQSFFERFSDVNTTAIHPVGSKLVLVSQKENINKLLGLYDAVWLSEQSKTVKIIPLTKLGVKEAEEIIQTFFKPKNIKVRPSFYQQSAEELMTMILPQGLVLIGDFGTVKRAEEILQDIEKQLDEPSQMTTFWYTCKHSDPKDLAEMLEKVYESLSQVTLTAESSQKRSLESSQKRSLPGNGRIKSTSSSDRVPPQNSVTLPVQPKFIQPRTAHQEKSTSLQQSHSNFIVDPKTTSVLMVIRKDLLPEIKRILKKIDVPKKMVHIEVLLVEKKIHDRNQVGINLLKIGTPASDKRETGIQYDPRLNALDKGVLSFLLSRPKGSLPAFDFVYSFLMAQDDIRINANPSVIAINQTPATISITEELSINNGAVLLDGGAQGVAAEKSFTRAQYGIVITMTPTIHLPDMDDEDQRGYVTLNTDVTFDTTQSSRDDRPPVTRRHVDNEVRIADGETIILGGLKRQSSENNQEKIPFLGDIPGIGKLFGTNTQTDSNTEMFIFITPRIIKDDKKDQLKLRQRELQKRPGDIPLFLEKMNEARDNESKILFEQSIKMLFE